VYQYALYYQRWERADRVAIAYLTVQKVKLHRVNEFHSAAASKTI